jgi:hypothetical protein
MTGAGNVPTIPDTNRKHAHRMHTPVARLATVEGG